MFVGPLGIFPGECDSIWLSLLDHENAAVHDLEENLSLLATANGHA